jgi:DNA-binding Lrp family transcriptional regulator
MRKRSFFFCGRGVSIKMLGRLSDIDIMILRCLMNNCRMSYEKIAKLTNVSSTTIKKHVSVLNRNGIINEYLVKLSLSILGAFSTLTLVRTEGNEDRKKFMDDLGLNPFIEKVSRLQSGLYVIESIFVEVNNLLFQDNFFRNHPMVISYETHIPKQQEQRNINLKRMDLKLLNLLLSNPRKSISSLCSETGCSMNRVRMTLKRLQREMCVSFTINPSLYYYFGQLKIESGANLATESLQLNRHNSNQWKLVYTSDDSHLFLWFLMNDITDVSKYRDIFQNLQFRTIVEESIGEPVQYYNSVRIQETAKLCQFLA